MNGIPRMMKDGTDMLRERSNIYWDSVVALVNKVNSVTAPKKKRKRGGKNGS